MTGQLPDFCFWPHTREHERFATFHMNETNDSPPFHAGKYERRRYEGQCPEHVDIEH